MSTYYDKELSHLGHLPATLKLQNVLGATLGDVKHFWRLQHAKQQ